MTIDAHADEIPDCAVAPDGSFVVSAGQDRTAKLWDTASGKLMRVLPHSGPVWTCAVSPDGTFIVTGGMPIPPRHQNERRVIVWDTLTGRERAAIEGLAFAVSPDSRFVVVGGAEHLVQIWDAIEGQRVAAIALHGVSDAVDVHPWLPVVVCGASSGGIYLLDLVGIEYGPVVVTAVDRGGGGPAVRCPRCRAAHLVEATRLGREMTCPSCDLRLRANERAARSPVPATRRRLGWFRRLKG